MNSEMSVFIVVVLASFMGPMCDKAQAVLPPDFPGIQVTTYTPAAVGDGYIFLAVASVTEGIGTYLMILDNNGDPVWYEKLDTHEIYDFKVNPNGYLSSAPFIHEHSYTGGGDAYHEIRDDSYNIVEEVHGKNGYVAEAHDFQILPNGNLLQFGYYMSEVDMSQIVDGGHPGALVSGGVVQELDAQRNVVFQWRSWDYYNFEDVTPSNRRPTGATLSEFHFNTINQDPDGNIILGTPSEVRKINRQNGEVMWILGGDNNDFAIDPQDPNASVDHFGGHATYRLENGNFLMYDNGSRTGDTSSIHEYTLDEVNKTATHVWSWVPATSVPAWHRGNAQRLPNGNTVIGWGGARSTYYIPAITEVTPAGDVVFELYFDPNSPPVESYRAFRFPYPPETQAIEHEEIELATGDTIPFGDTGVAIKVNTGGGGYNECIVTREPYAPVAPVFPSKAPRVLPVRINMTEFDIGSMGARIDFDNTSFGFDNPDDLTVYYRTTTGQGLFLPQTTTNTGSALRITITLNSVGGDFGEFIFCYDDVADVAYPPILCQPENYRGVQDSEMIAPVKSDPNTTYLVNEELDILLSWSPKGLARYNFVQVATDENFTNLVVDDQEWITECRYIWSGASAGTTYYWRAKIWNEAGHSDWSTASFQTVAPVIEVTAPVENELLNTGSDYFIQWNDNIAEDVIIDLYKGDVLNQTIATVPSDRAYEWEVDLALAPGCDYSIKIKSSVDEALFDVGNSFRIDMPDGDFDCNGCVKFDDFIELAGQWLDTVNLTADIDNSGQVDFKDFSIFAGNWDLCPMAAEGDFNLDGCVNLTDLAELTGQWLNTGDLIADINNSGKVDFSDFSILAENWDATCP